jgi:hypothetical protein
MKIFLSWSGNQSHLLAQAFKDWLPEVIQSLKPFLSSKDISAGVQWFPKLKAELETADFGIVCLTKTNLKAEYIMLESGAMAMRVDAAKLVPVLCDVSEVELVKSPLTAFNYVHLTPEGVLKLLESINNSSPEKVSEETLRKRFHRLWPDLEETTKAIIETPDKDAPEKKAFNAEAAIEQILANINAQARHDQIMASLINETLKLVRQVTVPNPALVPRAPLGFSMVPNTLLQDTGSPYDAQRNLLSPYTPYAGSILDFPHGTDDDPSKKEPKDE